jgi:carboxymethylenebutenolidase
MCYDDQARPPLPPGEAGPAHSEDLVLEADDGNRFMACYARPESDPQALLLLLPDVRGLHQFYKDLALCFAESGIATMAIDYFGRTDGLGNRDESFAFRPHVEQMTQDSFFKDAAAGLAALREKAGKLPAFTLGFCMGGTLSFISGTRADFSLNGVVGFYSGMTRDLGGGTLLDQATHIRYPALGLFGAADAGIPPEHIESFKARLNAAGVEYEVISYRGAPHSFFDRRMEEFADASTDAWQRVLSFIKSHSEA